jgi:3-dehydroquinate synthase class II
MTDTSKEYDLPAFYRYKEYRIIVEALDLSDSKYEGIAYKHSHHNPQFVVVGDDWKILCSDLEGMIDELG